MLSTSESSLFNAFKVKQVLLHKALEVYLKTSPIKAVVGLESALKNATNTL